MTQEAAASATQKERKWVDITQIFKNAADSLTHSDPFLCNPNTFNLQDSMGALELTDEKMDCCEIPVSQVIPFGRELKEEDKERKVFPRPTPTGLDDTIDPLPWNELTVEDAAHIALNCLVRLESMLGGASVVESTYTCLYAHKVVMEDMQQHLEVESADGSKEEGFVARQAVFASVLVLLELTDVIRGIVLNADIYEEEDFTVSTYGIKGHECRNETTVLQVAKAALEGLSALPGQNSDAVQCLTLILRYQLDFLSICSSMARLSEKQVQKAIERVQRMSIVAAKRLEELLAISKRLQENETDSTKSVLQRTFNSHVNRPLVGNAPVRKISFLPLSESIEALTAITKEIDWALCKTMLKGNTLSRARRMLQHVSKSSTNILTRSLLVLNLYFDEKLFGQHALQDKIQQHMQQLSHIPTEIFENSSTQAFLGRLAKPVYDVLKVMALNRNRQRPYIEAVMFPDWANLNQEARIIDNALRSDTRFGPDTPPHFFLYVLYITIDLMDHYVALSVELKLMSGSQDMAVAFWYRDFLLNALINQLAVMRQAKVQAKEAQHAAAVAAAAAAKRGKKKGGKNKKHANGNHKPAATPQETEDDFEFYVVNLKQVLCRGIVRFAASATQTGLIRDTNFEFTSKEAVFEKRFEALGLIQQPPQLTYQDYVAGLDFSKVNPEDLIRSATECFSGAKAYVDRLLAQLPSIGTDYASVQEEELRRLAKVCIGNSIYLQKLKQCIPSSSGKAQGTIQCETETHSQFCTFKIS